MTPEQDIAWTSRIPFVATLLADRKHVEACRAHKAAVDRAVVDKSYGLAHDAYLRTKLAHSQLSVMMARDLLVLFYMFLGVVALGIWIR